MPSKAPQGSPSLIPLYLLTNVELEQPTCWGQSISHRTRWVRSDPVPEQMDDDL